MNSTATTRTILLHRRIHAARASLERSRTQEERASALVEEADALLSFQAYAHDHHVFDVESLAARVAMGEVTVREAFDHCDPLDLYSNELLRLLSPLMGPSDWINHVERPSPAELFSCVQSCYRRGDLAGCLSLLRHYAANLDDWFYGDCLWIRQLVGMWGRDALAPFYRDLRRVEAVFEQENHSSGTPRMCLRAAWALTQDDATQARCVREVLSEYDQLCSLDPPRIHADRDPRAAVVELLLTRGLSEKAVDLFERIAEPPAEGIDQQQATGCVGLQRLLPSLASALAAERYARVEAYVFDRWIAPAHPRQLSSWLAVLRSDARARTLALLEAASPRDIDTPLSRLPFSVRPAVLRAVLGQLREQGVAPGLTALIEDRPGLEQAMLQAPLEEDFYRSGVTMSPEQRVFDLLVCAARAGELEAIEALREWRSPNEITRPAGWFRELPRDALRVMMQRIFATRDTANELNFRWLDMLRRGSADARRRWRPMVAGTEYEPSLLDHGLRGDGLTEDERARDTQARCEQLASSDRWADGVGLVRSARGAPWARKAVAALCDRWLDECERDPDALSQRAWDAAEQLLTVASPVQLQRASRLRGLRESERLTHGFVVGSVRAERDFSLDLSALREDTIRAYAGRSSNLWFTWVRARFAGAGQRSGPLVEAIQDSHQYCAWGFGDDCVALGIVAEVISASVDCYPNVRLNIYRNLAANLSEEQRSFVIPLALEAIEASQSSHAFGWLADWFTPESVAVWLARSGWPSRLIVLDDCLVSRLGGIGAIDAIGDKIAAQVMRKARASVDTIPSRASEA